MHSYEFFLATPRRCRQATRPLQSMMRQGRKNLDTATDLTKMGKHGQISVMERLSKLPSGRQGHVKTVKSEAELKDFFNSVTEGAKTMPSGNYPGIVKKLQDGSIVRMRGSSKSGGSTLDITLSDGKVVKVHIEK